MGTTVGPCSVIVEWALLGELSPSIVGEGRHVGKDEVPGSCYLDKIGWNPYFSLGGNPNIFSIFLGDLNLHRCIWPKAPDSTEIQ